MEVIAIAQVKEDGRYGFCMYFEDKIGRMHMYCMWHVQGEESRKIPSFGWKKWKGELPLSSWGATERRIGR